jgi:curli biogenesis system outer membrane secretion channel CsgG
MKKVILVLTLALAVVFVKAQDNTTKSTSATPAAKPAEKIVRTPVKPADLLKVISEDISANYKEYKVVNAFKVVKGDVTKFEVNVQKGTVKERLIYDAEGKFLEKKTPPAKPATNPKAAPASTTPATDQNK